MMGKLYIVTGACGHLGNTIVRALLQRGEKVRCLALPDESTKPMEGLEVELFRGDVVSRDSILPLFTTDSRCEKIVIHAAGIVTVASQYHKEVYDVNVLGTQNVIDICLDRGVSRLVYISTVHVLPELPAGQEITEVDSFDPDLVIGSYAKTKASATQAVLDSLSRGLDAVVVHPSGIIGPNDFGKGHLTQMVIDFLNGSLKACVKGGYDFVDVRDVAEGVLLAADKGRRGQCYILSNRYFSTEELLDCLHEVSGQKRVRLVLPRWFVQLIAPLTERYYQILNRAPLFTRYSLYTLYSNANFSHQKAERELGYTVRQMRETLVDTVAFLRDNQRVRIS